MKGRRIVAPATLAIAGAVAYVAASAPQRTPRPPRPVPRAGKTGVPVETKPGLVFHLADAEDDRTGDARLPPASATPLGDAATQALLKRLPPLPPDQDEPFALRESSLPPPRTGRVVAATFPPAAEKERAGADDTGPLEVARFQPVGNVPLAPHLSVTFSKPMVAVTSHQDLANARPVRLTPEPPGEWRWVGAKTLLFAPRGRFPMATDYRAEIPAGTRDARGGTLAKAVAFTFATPSPTLVGWYPRDAPASRDPLLVVAFDQRLAEASVIANVRLQAGGQSIPVRPARADEIAGDEQVRRQLADAPPGQAFALRPTAPLPADSAVTVVVAEGTPSAEGPRPTSKAQSWTFRTYGPLRVTKHTCGWNGRCPPLAPWQIELSNPIDARGLRKEMASVSPEVPGLKVEAYGSSLVLRGAAKGRTRYTVTLAGVPDTFGQALDPSVVTFDVGPAEPMLHAPGGGLVVLDPAAPPRFPIYSVNHDRLQVRVFAVSPEAWPAFQTFLQQEQRGEKAAPPGRLLRDWPVTVGGRSDEITETRLDLRPFLPNGLGQIVLLVDAPSPARPGGNNPRFPPRVRAWVQATRMAVDAFADDRGLLAWATSLTDGKPLAGVSVRLLPGGTAIATADTGLATLPLSDAPGAVLEARLGDDVALLPENVHGWGQGWKRRPPGSDLLFYVADDRRLYRPGEEVRVKGWVRRIGSGPSGDVAEAAEVRTIAYTLKDSRGNEVGKGTRDIGRLGGFDLTLTLPPTMNLGPAILAVEAPGGSHRHQLDVQEFRRPEFEVKATAGEGPFLVGERATVTVEAAYYAGGGLADAETTWTVSSTPATFTPPNRGDFVFGSWVPWWRPWGQPAQEGRTETHAAQTDAAGRHVLRIAFEKADPPRASSIHAQASVLDVNRQAWAGSVNLLVHPSSLYVGLRARRAFVRKGEPILVEAIVTDLDGTAVSGRSFSVRADRLDWEQVEGEWKETVAGTEKCAISSGTDAVPCRFGTGDGGVIRLTATVADDRGRPNETEMRIYVAGGRALPARGVEAQEVTLVPDRKEYAAGDTAEVLVMGPFEQAQGLVTLRRSGLVRAEGFTLAGGSHTLRIPIEEGWTPNVHLQVDLVGAAARESTAAVPDRPAFATGTVSLPIPPRGRTLAVEAAPRDAKVAPGGKTTIDVRLRGPEGRPVAGADVAVVVVDEAVLGLTGYRLPDPLEVFYPNRPPGVTDVHLRASVLLANPDDLPGAQENELVVARDSLSMATASFAAQGMLAPAPATAKMAAAGGASEPIRLRTDLTPLALFAASLPTDGQGAAQVTVTVPDSLTRYRIMAVAAAGARQFGSGESTLTARLPLMVRPQAPRFLNFGDRFELPVVVQNQTTSPMSVDVAVRASNATLTAGAGRRVAVPANDRVEVRFPAAARSAGKAVFQVAAAGEDAADAASVELPVWTPATTEAFATYGQIDQGAIAQPVRAPTGAVTQFGGLEVTISSTALQALTDAVLYLVAYPFECAEQLSSRVLAVAALKDVLGAFEAKGLPPPDEMKSAMKRDIDRLRGLQNPDGGFAFWRRGDPSWPYVGIHVAHALERAKAKGFDVPNEVMQRSAGYLKRIESQIPADYRHPRVVP